MSIAYNDIAQKVKKKLGISISTEAHTESEVISYINDAISMITRERSFPFTHLRTTFTISAIDVPIVIPETYSVYWVKKGDVEYKILDAEAYWQFPSRSQVVAVYDDTAIAPETGTYEMMYR